MNAALLGAARRRADERKLTLPTAGLIAFYDFVQGADPQVLYDRSGNGYHGTLGGTAAVEATDPAWTPQGLSFDGSNDYVVIPSAPFNFGTSAFTLIAVVNPNNVVPLQFFMTQDGGGGITNWEMQVVNGRFTGRIGIQGGASVAFNSNILTGGGPRLLTVTVEPGVEARAYLENGDPVIQSLAGVTPSNFNGTSVYLGKRNSGNLLTGSISAAAAYSRAITPAEVRTIYRTLRRQLGLRSVFI